MDLGVEFGFLQKSGSWYSYEHEKIGQGKDNAKQFLRDNPEKAKALETAIREKAFANRNSTSTAHAADDSEFIDGE